MSAPRENMPARVFGLGDRCGLAEVCDLEAAGQEAVFPDEASVCAGCHRVALDTELRTHPQGPADWPFCLRCYGDGTVKRRLRFTKVAAVHNQYHAALPRLRARLHYFQRRLAALAFTEAAT